MRLSIACVGRGKNALEQVLCDDYLKRASGLGAKFGLLKIELVVVETSRAADAATRMKEEAERLGAKLGRGVHLIACDERGKTFTSVAFAQHLARLGQMGGDAAFLIGGPDGLAPDLRDQSRETLALGPQTWPHLLVRAMLAEQVYRGLSILSNHPYHRAGGR